MRSNRTRKQRGRRSAAVVLALGLGFAAVVLANAEVAFAQGAPEPAALGPCHPHDPELCMEICEGAARRCHSACSARRRQCLLNAYVEAKACKIECREGAEVEDPGACRRRCIKEALVAAKKRCRLGQPVCRRLCNPEPCKELCYELLAESDTSLSGTPVVSDCDPSGNRECILDCARGLRGCVGSARRNGRRCVRSCEEFEGEEKAACIHDCVSATREELGLCATGFRECVGSCWTPDPATGSAG
ncbi:MAG: hypothetical protein ACE5E4_08965 [Candidatus Binatia bacterium]